MKTTTATMLSVTAAAAMLHGASAGAADLPTYELMGFPITPVQFALVGPTHIRERSPVPTLVLGGMPASPHQVAVLTPRPRKTGGASAPNTIKAGFSAAPDGANHAQAALERDVTAGK